MSVYRNELVGCKIKVSVRVAGRLLNINALDLSIGMNSENLYTSWFDDDTVDDVFAGREFISDTEFREMMYDAYITSIISYYDMELLTEAELYIGMQAAEQFRNMTLSFGTQVAYTENRNYRLYEYHIVV